MATQQRSAAATPRRQDGYAPIRDYAAIGNGRMAALVARDGAIDWLCVPGLDGEPLLAAVLDPDEGGAWTLAPEEPFAVERAYEPGTNLLTTTFRTDHGTVRVTDAFAMPDEDADAADWSELVREVEGLAGSVAMRWRFAPLRGLWDPAAVQRRDHALMFPTEHATLVLHAWDAGELAVDAAGVGGGMPIEEGRRATFVLGTAARGPLLVSPRGDVERGLARTRTHWRRLAARCTYDGPWREPVLRSVLALELLFERRSGAMAAAATLGLPEAVGGNRNYDYRYAWLRDMDFALNALLPLGYHRQVHASLRWGLATIARTHPRLRPFYRLDGRPIRGQRELPLRGWRDSRPVIAGNGAAEQLQLGNYGHMLGTAWRYVEEGNVLDHDSARQLAELATFVCDIWGHDDSGIWELSKTKPYTMSKVFCWQTLDRALRLARAGAIPDRDAARWSRTAEEIRAFVWERCWSQQAGALAEAAGEDGLDASLLLAARNGFADRDDPRLHATIDAIRRELGAGGPLLYRTSRLAGHEGAFVACSFWLAEALALTGRGEEALATMDATVALASDVGLYAEEIDPAGGAFLGNTPQALSHLALVSAAQRCAALGEAR